MTTNGDLCVAPECFTWDMAVPCPCVTKTNASHHDATWHPHKENPMTNPTISAEDYSSFCEGLSFEPNMFTPGNDAAEVAAVAAQVMHAEFEPSEDRTLVLHPWFDHDSALNSALFWVSDCESGADHFIGNIAFGTSIDGAWDRVFCTTPQITLWVEYGRIVEGNYEPDGMGLALDGDNHVDRAEAIRQVASTIEEVPANVSFVNDAADMVAHAEAVAARTAEEEDRPHWAPVEEDSSAEEEAVTLNQVINENSRHSAPTSNYRVTEYIEPTSNYRNRPDQTFTSGDLVEAATRYLIDAYGRDDNWADTLRYHDIITFVSEMLDIPHNWLIDHIEDACDDQEKSRELREQAMTEMLDQHYVELVSLTGQMVRSAHNQTALRAFVRTHEQMVKRHNDQMAEFLPVDDDKPPSF